MPGMERIAALEAEVARLRAQLVPFCEWAHYIWATAKPDWPLCIVCPDDNWSTAGPCTVSDLERLLVLEREPEPEPLLDGVRHVALPWEATS